MPIYMRDNRLIHHIHIPRCGGTSISNLLESNGWTKLNLPVPQEFETAFEYGERPKEWKPVYTKHEHKPVWKAWIETPEINPDFQFAIVRNPYEKFNSALVELSKNKNAIKWADRINSDTIYRPPRQWLEKLLLLISAGNHNIEHNLFCPQSRFMDVGVHVYKIEIGLEKLIEDLVSKDIVKKESVILHKGKKPVNISIKAPWHEPTYQPLREIFEKIYEEDFNNLGYIKRHFIGDSDRD